MISANKSLAFLEARIRQLTKEKGDLEREQKRMRKIELEVLADAYARKLRAAGFTIEQGAAALRGYKHFDAKPASRHVQKPSMASADRSVFATATRLMGDDAKAWLERPHPLLGGISPDECCASPGGVKKVQALLAAYSE
ncbi:hypothetical protein ABIC63_002751 [Pseudacidovorax sp. 1753]|uniref:MbcA/ParS/Xre antitoxin family protein n=1 Tax=Pseudacidovorax sp. 1753 TaxID=3156419 RepID=UPI003397ECD1